MRLPWLLVAFAGIAAIAISPAAGGRRSATAGGPSASQKPELRIQLEEPAGVNRRGAPITSGVPFPRGARKDLTNVRLQRVGSKSALPVQWRILSRWPDGSVRWALLDWQTDLSARQRQQYRLANGPPVKPQSSLKLTDDGDMIAVDTGVIRLTIPRKRFAVIENVRIAGKQSIAGPVTAFMDIEGTRYEASPPSQVTVLEQGPLRARIELRGEYGAEFHYVIRIDAYAGQSFVRVLHSFEQRGSKPSTAVRQMALTARLRESAGATASLPPTVIAASATSTPTSSWTYTAGRESNQPLTGALAKLPLRLFQEDPHTLRLNGELQEGRAAGWVDVHHQSGGIAMAGRFFWQEYPQSYHLSADELTYNLWAPEAEAAAIGMGAAKTHEVVLQFSGSSAPTLEQLSVMAEPLLAQVDPGWIAASGALPNSIAPSTRTAGFIEELRAGFQRVVAKADVEPWDEGGTLDCAPGYERRREGFYGMLNFGDWNYPWYHDVVNGCDTWGNLEYDLSQVLALAYAATGDRAFHHAMTAAARHFMDVDRIHSAPPACDCVGMTHVRTVRHFAFEKGDVDLGHVWTEGLLSYFYLTGDERALGAAREIADYLVRRLTAGNLGTTPRQWGWPQIALVSVYEATGNPSYKEAAQEYARRAIVAYPPATDADFGVGTLAEGLSYVNSVSADPALREWLTAHAAAVMLGQPGVAPRYFPAVAYVGHITGNKDYEREALAAVSREQFGDWGKPFTIAGRLGFRILALFR